MLAAEIDAMALPSPLDADLLPVLRARSACAMEALADRIFGEDLAHLPPVGRIGPDLVIALAAARESGAALIEQGQLGALGLEPSAAFERSVANLLRRSAPRFAELGDGLFASDWNDGFDASRLLFLHLFAGLPVKGDVVAMAPTNSRLLVTGADDRSGLAAMAEAAADALSATERPLSAQPLRLRDGSWIGFAPDAAEFVAFQDLRRGQWIRDYAEQKQLLDQLNAQEGDRILVAEQAAMLDRASGRPFCLTFWVDGAPSLLPQADMIGFKSAREVILVPWDAALPIVENRMTKTGHYPARFRIETFPDASDIERLRAVAKLAKPIASHGAGQNRSIR